MTVDPLVAELRDRREKAGLTQRQLADAMHCVQSHVSMLEAGRTDLQLDTLRRWAAALGVQPAWVPLTYRPGFEDPQTAPVERFNSAGHGAPRQPGVAAVDGVPASAQVEVGSDLDRADVAPEGYVLEKLIGTFGGDIGPCDAPGGGSSYMMPDGSIGCRCIVCGRCGHHTGNSNQGHYWAYCKATGQKEEFHLCCPGDCELHPSVARTLDVAERTVEKARTPTP